MMMMTKMMMMIIIIIIVEMLKFDKRTTNYTIKKITNIAIRTSYYIFCRRNKEWTDPELMTL